MTTGLPGVYWVDSVACDPVRALEEFTRGWFPAVPEPENDVGELADIPPGLLALHRLARARPAFAMFHNRLLKQPRHEAGRLGDRLVFACENQYGWDWSVPWPTEAAHNADPPVWMTFDPKLAHPETVVEVEPLGRFLLQYILYEALGTAPQGAWTRVMPTERLDALADLLRPVPLSPFLPMFTAERFFVAPGLVASVGGNEVEVVASFGALRRETLTSLREHDFPWGDA